MKAPTQRISISWQNAISKSNLRKEGSIHGYQLIQGTKIDLTKTNPGLSKITVGLGWDTNKYDGGKDFDLDVSVFLTNASGKVDKETNFIFFNNKQNENASVVHTGDNRTGEGDGDDEQVQVDLLNVPADVDKIAFTITIYEAESRSQNFGQVSRSYVRIVNDANSEN